MNKKLLALGIPTYKRPEFAVRAIKEAVAMNIYDQIIVSSNSHEKQLDRYIKNLGSEKVTYHQQDSNVGMSLNYLEVIALCECKYLHIVSDEDYINEKNTRALYSKLSESNDVSLIVLSIRDIEGQVYRDASWQKNKTLRNVFGETGHIGSSVINIDLWDEEAFIKMSEYCNRKGDVYPTSAAAIITYSIGKRLLYFPPHIVEMGKLHTVLEMSGYGIYGFESRLNQYISLIMLLTNVSLKEKTTVYGFLVYFFSHHAFRDSVNKYDDNPLEISKKIMAEDQHTFKINFFIVTALLIFYYFSSYYFLRKLAGKILRKDRLG